MLPILHFSIERWRKNEEYGVYVSNQGRIKSLRTKEDINIRITGSGYCTVFTDKGSQYVHRLVAYTWLGAERNANYNVDHINSNKRDNSVKNLRWVPITLNTQYAQYTLAPNEPVEDNKIPELQAVEKDKVIWTTVPTYKAREEALRRMLNTKSAKLWFLDKKIQIEYWSFEDAYKATINPKLTKSCPLDNFIKGVIKSCMTNKPYCGFVWHFEEIK